MGRVGSIRKRKDVLATLFIILVCVVVIITTALVVKRHGSPSEPVGVDGSLPENKNEALVPPAEELAEEEVVVTMSNTNSSVGAAAPTAERQMNLRRPHH